MNDLNLKDMLVKLFWTMANAALAAAVVWAGDLEVAWGGLALVLFQLASTWVRQQTGATPPEAPAEGVFASRGGP